MDLTSGRCPNWSNLAIAFLSQLTVKEVAGLGISGTAAMNTKPLDVD
ncbi:MAG: hypothetical protein WB581_06415 [Halobacteriota archaeon]